MPRRARLAIAGVPWHIVQRGNNRQTCFHNEEDFKQYLRMLTEQAGRLDCHIHAYVLMRNHIHLLITPQHKDGPSQLMKLLGQRYTQYFNRTYDRTGTLWEGRFRSCLTQSEAYVLACYRYIELNPVRANMVFHPGDYRWSSYAANGEGAESFHVTPHPEYLRLGHRKEIRLSAYRNLINNEISNETLLEIRKATNGNYVLGNDLFRAEMRRKLRRRVTCGKPGRPCKKKYQIEV